MKRLALNLTAISRIYSVFSPSPQRLCEARKVLMRPGSIAIGVILLAALTVTSSAKELSQPTPSLTFGIYQSDKATVMYKMFFPVIQYIQTDLKRRLGRPVDIQLRIFRSYDEGIESLVAGKVDFVRFGPASYITAKGRNNRVKLLAMEHKSGKKRFKGLIIVAVDSPIRSLTDLKGHSFAFGDRNSTIGRYLAQAELVKAGIHANDLRNFDYLGRHDKVARAVEVGDYDAGAVKIKTYKKANKNGTLRIVVSFDNLTKPWVAREDLDASVFEALQKSLFGLTDPAVLKKLKVSGFMATSDTEYEFVREAIKMAQQFES